MLSSFVGIRVYPLTCYPAYHFLEELKLILTYFDLNISEMKYFWNMSGNNVL